MLITFIGEILDQRGNGIILHQYPVITIPSILEYTCRYRAAATIIIVCTYIVKSHICTLYTCMYLFSHSNGNIFAIVASKSIIHGKAVWLDCVTKSVTH